MEACQVAVYGLGVMGSCLARNLLRKGFRVAVYSVAEPERAKEMFLDIASGFLQNRKADFPELIEDVLHRIACRSAIKAHDQNNRAELEELVRIICADENVRYCPHGRPVMIRYTRKEIEKQFGRIV